MSNATITDDEARAQELSRVGADAVERRAVGGGTTVRNRRAMPDESLPRASSRGAYRDTEGRRRIVGSGQPVPVGWTRIESASVNDRVGEVETNQDPYGRSSGDGKPKGASSSRSKPGSSKSKSSSGGGDVDKLSGAVLNSAVERAGIDASTGGSNADGSMSADEKREALKAKRAGGAS